MAKRDEESTSVSTDKKEQKSQEADSSQQVKAAKSVPPWPLITIGVFVTVLVLAFFTVGWLGFASLHKQASRTGGYSMQRGDMNTRDHFGSRYRGGGYARSAAASGVVTKIDGDTVTIAGYGKQVTVKKTDSTVVSGDKSDLAVNDSVAVYGTTASDGTVTATRILVRNLSAQLDDTTPGRGRHTGPSI